MTQITLTLWHAGWWWLRLLQKARRLTPTQRGFHDPREQRAFNHQHQVETARARLGFPY